MPLLELENVEAAYGPLKALHGVSLAVEQGQAVAVLGPNGAGKTTALRAISGTVRTTGRIAFDGKSIAGRAPESIARLGVAHVPEGRGTFTHLTTEENLRLGAYRRDPSELEASFARVYRYFPRLAERRQQPAGTLSGGEQQMLAIARAVMSRPSLILLDEPSFGLAPRVVESIFAIIERIRKEQRVSVLLVEQNAVLALALADRAYLIETGYVVTAGSAKALADDPQIRRSYLGY